jgi:3-deoxy-D-manno-octulosonic-acid transferase
MGEVRAIKPLIKEFEEESNISVITNTGFDEAKTICKNVRFLPFEIFLPFWINKTKSFSSYGSRTLVYAFFNCKKKGAKTLLINARISDKSYKSYKRFRFFYKKILKI